MPRDRVFCVSGSVNRWKYKTDFGAELLSLWRGAPVQLMSSYLDVGGSSCLILSEERCFFKRFKFKFDDNLWY